MNNELCLMSLTEEATRAGRSIEISARIVDWAKTNSLKNGRFEYRRYISNLSRLLAYELWCRTLPPDGLVPEFVPSQYGAIAAHGSLVDYACLQRLNLLVEESSLAKCEAFDNPVPYHMGVIILAASEIGAERKAYVSGYSSRAMLLKTEGRPWRDRWGNTLPYLVRAIPVPSLMCSLASAESMPVLKVA